MTEAEERALEKFKRLREHLRQLGAAYHDALDRARDARALAREAEGELEAEIKATRSRLYGGQPVKPHPDKFVHRDRTRAEAERLNAEVRDAESRASALGQVVDSCLSELRSRGLDPDRERPRGSNARGHVEWWGFQQ